MSTDTRARSLSWGLAAAVLGAVVLRAIGLAYGLPAVYNPDEVAIFTRAMGLGQTHFNPHNFLYPTLYFYALFAWEGLWFLVGRVAGVFDSLAAFERAFFVDPTSLYLTARLLTLVCGVVTVVAIYRLGSRLFDRTAGVAAALLLAAAPLAVRDAHYVKHDVPVTLLIVLVHLVVAADLTDTTGRRRPVLMGVLAGLAMSTHYYAVFVVPTLVIAALAPARIGEPWGSRWTRLARTAAGAICAFALTSPFLLVEPATVWRDLVGNRAIVMDRVTGTAGAFGSLGFYAGWLRSDAAGMVTAGLAAVGFLVALARGWRVAAVSVVFPVLFLLFIANTYPASRYLNPVVPFLTLLAGGCIAWIARDPRRGGAVVAALLLLVALAESTRASVRTDLFIRQTDTRTQALQWIEQHVPDGASVLVQPYSVPLRQSREGLVEALTAHLGSTSQASVKFQRQLALTPYPTPAYRAIYLGEAGEDKDKIYVPPSAFDGRTLDALRQLSVNSVVLKQYNVPDPSMQGLVEALRREGQLVKRFSPYPEAVDWGEFVATPPFLHNSDARIAPILERPGPIIEIWTIH